MESFQCLWLCKYQFISLPKELMSLLIENLADQQQMKWNRRRRGKFRLGEVFSLQLRARVYMVSFSGNAKAGMRKNISFEKGLRGLG
jgi:hypothetical protein